MLTNKWHFPVQSTPPPSPAPVPVRAVVVNETERQDIQEALKDIRSILQRTKTLPGKTKYSDESNLVERDSPVWVPRNSSPDESVVAECTEKDQVQEEEEADTDLETDRLLGQQRLDDKGFYDDKVSFIRIRERSLSFKGRNTLRNVKNTHFPVFF